MRKGSKKRTTLALVLLFLIGAVMFIWPMVSEVTSYQADNEEYPVHPSLHRQYTVTGQ